MQIKFNKKDREKLKKGFIILGCFLLIMFSAVVISELIVPGIISLANMVVGVLKLYPLLETVTAKFFGGVVIIIGSFYIIKSILKVIITLLEISSKGIKEVFSK